MERFTYRPAPLARKITLTLDGTVLTWPGKWQADLSRVVALRRAVTNVKLHRIDNLELTMDDGRHHSLGLSVVARGAGSGEEALLFGEMLRAIYSAVPPDTPVSFGERGWVRWTMSMLGLVCLGFVGLILADKGFDPDPDVLGPGIAMLLMGALLLYKYHPFGPLPSVPAADMVHPAPG